MKMCYEAIGSSGGSYIELDSIAAAVKYTRRDVHADWVLADSIMGDGVHMTGKYGRPPSPDHRRFGRLLFALAEKWLHDGSIRHHPLKIQDGGLVNIPKAIDDLKLGNLHAEKLCFAIGLEAY